MLQWLSGLFRGPELDTAVRDRIARRLGRVITFAVPLIGLGALLTAVLGDPSRAVAPLVGLSFALVALAMGRQGDWIVAVRVIYLGVVMAAVVEIAHFGIGAPTLWMPLILLGAVLPLFGTRGAMVLLGTVAVLVGAALAAESWGWVSSASPTPVQQGLVVVQLTFAAILVLADPMHLLAGTLAESEAARRDQEVAELRFRAIFDQSSSLYALLSADGTLLDLNEAARARFGERSGEAVGAPLAEASWWTAEQAEDVGEGVAQAAAGRPHRFEVVVEGPPGSVFSGQVAPFHDPAGDVRSLVLEMMDVSDLVEARQLLQHKQRLEALGQLAGGVAHDFNNLLAAVLASADLLAMDPEVAEHPRRSDLARIIRDASERGAGLTRKLLAFGRRNTPTGRVHVDALFRSTVQMLRRSLGARIELVVELDAADAWVMADSSALDAVLVNLAVNARDAMPQGGTLAIRTSCVDLDPAFVASLPDPMAPGKALQLVVEDTGEGMSEEVRERAFEPFYTTKPVGSGTGLGLSAVHGTVLTHGGTLRLESQPGVGTSFTIFFPLAASATEVAEVSGTAPVDVETVLVVDDELVLRQAVAAQFRAHGVTVHAVASADEAEALLERGGFDLVLTDVVMPGRNGFDLARSIRERWPELPIIAMTGFTQLEPAGGEVLDVPVLRKPFEWPVLVDAIRRASTRASGRASGSP